MAEKAKDLYRGIDLQGYRRYFKAMTHESIRNCPVNVEDIKRAMNV